MDISTNKKCRPYVYVYLYMLKNSINGVVVDSLYAISKKLSVNASTIYRAVKVIESHGYLKKVNRFYVITGDEEHANNFKQNSNEKPLDTFFDKSYDMRGVEVSNRPLGSALANREVKIKHNSLQTTNANAQTLPDGLKDRSNQNLTKNNENNQQFINNLSTKEDEAVKTGKKTLDVLLKNIGNMIDDDEAIKIERDIAKKRKEEKIAWAKFALKDIFIKTKSHLPENVDMSAFAPEFHAYIKNAESCIKNGEGLFMYGNAGNGKTTQAILIASKAADFGYRSEYINGNLMNAENDHKSADLLIFDELDNAVRTYGSAGADDKGREIVYDIVDWRWKNKKATIFISNSSPDHLERSLGEKILSRIMHKKVTCIPYMGKDYRKGV